METTGKGISRRAFLEMAGVLGMGASVLALAGCGGAGAAQTGTAATSAAASASASGSPLRIGMDAAYVPYGWKQSNETENTLPLANAAGQYVDGFDIQLMKKVCEKLGREPEVYAISFNGLISALDGDQIDVIASGMSATDERKQSVDFSDPYLKSGVAMMVKKDSKYANATQLSDFTGASVLGQKSSLPDMVVDQIPGVNHLDPVDSIPDQIARLTQGTVDAIVVDENNKNIYEKLYPDFKVIVFDDGKGFDTPGVDPAIAVKKGDPEGILTAANEVIASMTDDDRQKLWDDCSERAPQ